MNGRLSEFRVLMQMDLDFVNPQQFSMVFQEDELIILKTQKRLPINHSKAMFGLRGPTSTAVCIGFLDCKASLRGFPENRLISLENEEERRRQYLSLDPLGG